MKQRGKIYGLMTALLACMIVMMMPGKVYAGDMELKEETVTADNIFSSGGFLTEQDGLLLEKLKGTKIASNLMAAKEAIREGIIARQESISVYDYNGAKEKLETPKNAIQKAIDKALESIDDNVTEVTIQVEDGEYNDIALKKKKRAGEFSLRRVFYLIIITTGIWHFTGTCFARKVAVPL